MWWWNRNKNSSQSLAEEKLDYYYIKFVLLPNDIIHTEVVLSKSSVQDSTFTKILNALNNPKFVENIKKVIIDYGEKNSEPKERIDNITNNLQSSAQQIQPQNNVKEFGKPIIEPKQVTQHYLNINLAQRG